MEDVNIQVPINFVSFGQVSLSLLREFYQAGYQPNIFPIGPVDINNQNISQDFGSWLQSCINKSITTYKRQFPTFKLWHIHDSFAKISDKEILYSFYELDSPTEAEINIVNNTNKTIFSSAYAAESFLMYGAKNVSSIPLGFDSVNFKRTEKPVYNDNRITFNILGKLERRKHHLKAIRAWLKKYGNDHRYFLQCAIWNPFFNAQELDGLYNQILDGKRYFNIQFYPFFATNNEYNQFLNSCDIVLCASGGEGWGLPEFHSVALGKHAVVHNCAGYSEWANSDNSVLVSPCGKIEAYDGKFFHKGQPFNQGNIFYFDDDEFIAGCESAIERVKNNPVNTEGLKLQTEFTYEKTFKAIEQTIFS